MSSDSRTDVLVVGAGPTGLARRSAARRGRPRRGADRGGVAPRRPQLRPRPAPALARPPRPAGPRRPGDRAGPPPRRRGSLRGHAERGPPSDSGGPRRFAFLLALPQSALEDLITRRLSERGVRVRWSHRLAGLEATDDGVVARVHKLAKESTGYAVAHTEWAIEKELTVPRRLRGRGRRPPLARAPGPRHAIRGGRSVAGLRRRGVRRGAGARDAARARRRPR